MKGPESFPKPSNSQEGGPMAKKKTAPSLSWTDDEKRIGDIFLRTLSQFQGTFNEKKNLAVEAMGYHDGYSSLPQGVRSYISHVGQEAKKSLDKVKFDVRVKTNLAQMKQDWKDQMENDPDFRHAMTHPDEEALEH